MKRLGYGLALAALVTGMSNASAATPEADKLFQEGRFAEALAAYAAVPAGSEDHAAALRRQGTIHLLANRWGEAETALRASLAINANDPKTASQMAELESRRGNYAEAARWSQAAGRPARAALFASFGNTKPYRIAGNAKSWRIPFEHVDPLPAMRASANGKEALFILDTGAAETVLDPEFAKTLGLTAGAGEHGTFAGGKTADVPLARLAKLQLGNLELADVPVALVSTAKFAPAANGKTVSGVIGTGLLSRFRATLDYPDGALELARLDERPRTDAAIKVPFWLAGDHFLLAMGRVNDGREQMFFADTGLAGFAFTAPVSTLAEAGIPFATPGAGKSGGIGTAAVTPFQMKSLSLGTLRRENLSGLYGAFPPSLETALGVRIGGIISHAYFRPYSVTFDFRSMVIEIRDEKVH